MPHPVLSVHSHRSQMALDPRTLDPARTWALPVPSLGLVLLKPPNQIQRETKMAHRVVTDQKAVSNHPNPPRKQACKCLGLRDHGL